MNPDESVNSAPGLRGENVISSSRVRIPRGVWTVVKEVARHVLRRPVTGIAAAARTADGRWLLIRRTDTGEWALPGGTLEWGERLRDAIVRELGEEAGVDVVDLGQVAGVYSDPDRDLRFHAVTIVVHALVTEPSRPPMNPMEVSEVALFETADLPQSLAHGMTRMLQDAAAGEPTWE
jgi:8-oxo-dGTP diphosphatase